MTDNTKSGLIMRREDFTIRKANALVQKSRYALSLPEQRLVNYVCSMINPKEEGDNGEPYQLEYTIDFQDYCRVCSLDMDGNRVYEDLKAAFDTLRGKCIWIPAYDETIGECEEQVGWFSKVRINKRSAKVRLDESLAPFLFEVKKNFSEFRMIDILGLRTAYAVHLFEILNSYAFMGVIKLDIDDLKHRLMVDEIPSYQRFPIFRQKVIDPAVAEINRRATIKVSYEPVKEGRKVAQLKFFIHQKDTHDRMVAHMDTINEIGDIGEPPKRGRGRPRKKPAPAPADQMSIFEQK